MDDKTKKFIVEKIKLADKNYHRYSLANKILNVSGLAFGVAAGILVFTNPVFGVMGFISTGLFTFNSTLEFSDRAQKQLEVKFELIRRLYPEIAELSYVLKDLDPELFVRTDSATIKLIESKLRPTILQNKNLE